MNSPCIREASEACFHGCSLFHSSSDSSLPMNHRKPSFRSEFKNSIASSLHRTFTNHESLPSMEESFALLTRAYPPFVETDEADHIRSRHYHHLASENHVCLDYIGHGLFSYAQTACPSSSMQPPTSLPVFETGHKSVNLGALVAYGGVESAIESDVKKRVISFMNMSEDDYTVVFTSSQSSAFKLVAENYPFRSNKKLLSVYDHESEAVEIMNDAAKKRGARIKSAEFSWPKLRIRSAKLMKMVIGKTKKRNQGLFVFPLQSRLSGSRYSYSWMSLAQEKGWHVLLDACALGPKDMETLGLSLFKPDFLICTFYKVFGNNPSGFACLFVKRSSASVLLQDSGAPSIGIVSLHHHPCSSSGLDDSSGDSEALSSSEIIQIETPVNSKIEFSGLDHADKLGLVLINTRGRYLINWLVNALLRLEHPDSANRFPLVQIYGPRVTFERAHAVAFNVFDWKGERVEPLLVQKLADRMGISLSYGFLKNMWVPDYVVREGEKATEFQGMEIRKKKGIKMCVVSVALGFLTNFEDVYRVWSFVSRFLDADFIEKERWRYTALNQQMFEV